MRSDRIVWLDLEYYSLTDPRVLECAVILTTCNSLSEVARKKWVIRTSREDIKKFVLGGDAGDFHQTHSMKNGLIEECMDDNPFHQNHVHYERWKEELLSFLKFHCQPGCRLAGFSPHVDREVLRTQAPLVYKFLSHKILDVASLDLVEWGLPQLETAARLERAKGCFDGNHRAMEDIEAAIAKVKWCQAWLRDKTGANARSSRTSENPFAAAALAARSKDDTSPFAAAALADRSKDGTSPFAAAALAARSKNDTSPFAAAALAARSKDDTSPFAAAALADRSKDGTSPFAAAALAARSKNDTSPFAAAALAARSKDDTSPFAAAALAARSKDGTSPFAAAALAARSKNDTSPFAAAALADRSKDDTWDWNHL
ncbi:hypothetical protein ACA910_012043 [Epithemia clementina (nom. ined.)]